MALVASGIEVPQPRWSHLLSAIPSAVDSRRPDWAEFLQILDGLENPQMFFSLHVLDLSLRCPTASRSFGFSLPSRS